MDCVLNFVALKVISEIDNLYAESLKEPRIKAALEEDKLPRIYCQGTSWKPTIFIRILKALYRILQFFFIVFYFYFFPFLTIAICQLPLYFKDPVFVKEQLLAEWGVTP